MGLTGFGFIVTYQMMNKKFMFLLFLVFFNFVSTSVADSHHLITSESSASSEIVDHSHDGPATPESQHCDDDSCHTGHYHHFIVSVSVFAFSSIYFFLTFSEPSNYFQTPYLDIIKPPLLIS